MAKLIINRFDAGLAPRFSTGRFQVQKLGAPGTYADGVCDPFSDLGVLSPPNNQFTAYTVTDMGTGKIIQAWARGSSSSYCVENGVNISALADGGTTVAAHGADIAAHGGHSTPQGQDIVMYQKNALPFLFYAWNDNIDGDVGVIKTDATSQDSDFMTTVPTGLSTTMLDTIRAPIILEVGANDFLYQFGANRIHKYDGTLSGGTNGIISLDVLDLPKDWIIRDAKDERGVMWIAAVKTQETFNISTYELPLGFMKEIKVFLWNKDSTDVKFTDYIPINGAIDVHCLFFLDGIAHVITTSATIDTSSRLTEVRKYNGREFVVVKQLPYNARPHRKGVVTDNGMATWLGADKTIYSYGSPYGELPPVIFKPSNVTGTIDLFGAALNIGGTMLLSYAYSSVTTYVSSWSPHLQTQTSTSGTHKSLVYELPRFSKITGVWVYWPGLASAGADINLAVSLYKNMNSTADKSFSINYSTDGTRGWFYQPIGTDNWHTIQIGFAWPSTATAVSSSIRPYRIEIEYEPTGKVK